MQKRITRTALIPFAFFFLLSLFSLPANAQRTEINDGREFHFGIPHCRKPAGETARGQSPLQLWISSKVKTRAIVRADGIGYVQPVEILPNIVKIVPLNDALMNTESEIVKANGISITAEAPISVTVFVSYKQSGEAFKVLPLEALGKEYYALSLYQDKSGNGNNDFKPGQILIVATADNTAVTYTPSVHTTRVNAGTPKTVFLKKGDTYLIESRVQPGQNQLKTTDLSGTHIKATKPIAVYSGHTKGAFPRYRETMLGTPANFMRNMLMEAMWPVNFLGTEYISAPIKYNNRPYTADDPDQRGDLIRFVATQDETQLYQMRQDGSGLRPIGMKLNKGQYYDIVEQEIAAYYKADKPVLVGQYGKAWRSSNVALPGKDDNIDKVLNPSRNGEGMLITLTPMDQWGSNAIFRAVDEVDNFTLIIFKTNEVDSIKFDQQPLRAAFSGLLKVEGTPYSYARKQIAAGDHNFQGTSSNIKFAVYSYGNFDYTKDGFAYGYPTSVNFAIKCDDSLAVEAEDVCGDYTGKAKALPANAECATLYNAYMIEEKSFNYEFALTKDLEPGLKELGFTVKVIDKTKDAKAFVKVITRSGRDTTLELSYYAQQVIATPNEIYFGTLAPNGKMCGNLTLTNPGTVDAVITNLFIKSGGANFTIDQSQLPITLKPQESKNVEVCAIAIEGMTKVDSVIADLECYRKGIAIVKYTTSEAQITISDALFRDILIGHSATLPVEIRNTGKTRVEVYSVDLPANLPFVTSGLLDKFPIILEKENDVFTFDVTYTPTTDANGKPSEDNFTAIFKANTDEVKTNSLWKGRGIQVLPGGNEYNWGEQRVIDNYITSTFGVTEWKGSVSFYAEQFNAILKVEDIYITDDTQNAFRLDQNTVNLLKGKDIDPANPKELQVIPAFFAPKAIGDYSAKVVLKGTTSDGYGNVEPREYTVELKGIGIQPAYNATDKDYGQVELNTPTSGTVRINSTGNTEVKILKMTIKGTDAANFKIDPAFHNGREVSVADPLPVLEGEYVDIPVIFTADKVKSFDAYIEYESDAPEQSISKLIGYSVSQDIKTTPYDFPATYISQTNTSGVVECQNLNPVTPINVSAVNFGGGADDARFTITGYKLKNAGTTFTTLPISIPGNDALQVMVNFTPDAVRSNYATRVNYTTSLGEVFSAITGIGKDMTSTVKIDRSYRASVGGNVPVTVDLKGSPDAINDGNIMSFKTTIGFNPSLVIPRTGAENIKMLDIATGWDVVSAEITDKVNGTFEVVVKTDDPAKALKGEGRLFEFTLEGYLDAAKECELPVSMTEYNRPWVNMLNEPGLVAVDPVCGGDIRLIAISSNQYQLMAQTPNPVTGSMTNIRYSIGIEGMTRLVMVNAQGQVVGTLVNENQKPGMYEVTVDVSKLPSGKYFYQIQSGPFTQSEQMMISK